MGEEVPCVSDSPLNVHAQYILPHNAAVPPGRRRYFRRRRRPLPNDPIHAICHAIDAIAAKNSQDLAQRPSIGLIQRHPRSHATITTTNLPLRALQTSLSARIHPSLYWDAIKLSRLVAQNLLVSSMRIEGRSTVRRQAALLYLA